MNTDKRLRLYYYLFDWANSPFSTIIITFIFSSYFVNAIAENKVVGTSLWGWTIALSGILISVIAPYFGLLADNKNKFAKQVIIIATFIISLLSILLWFSKPHSDFLIFTLFIIFISNTLFELSQVFYNSQLVYFKKDMPIGHFSGKAWAIGYLGGIFCLLLILFLFVLPEENFLHLQKDKFEHIRVCGPIVGVWYLFFSLPFLLEYQNQNLHYKTMQNSKSLSVTFKLLKKFLVSSENKNKIKFFIARMLYTDGLITLFSFGGIYASGTFGFSFTEIIYFGISLNITAALGAYFFGIIEDRIGIKKIIILSLLSLSIICILILITNNKYIFWVLGVSLGFFIGSVQSSSRTALINLAKGENLNGLFGIYAVSGKVTNFLGPFLVASFTAIFESQKAGMTPIIFFLILGLLLLSRTKF